MQSSQRPPLPISRPSIFLICYPLPSFTTEALSQVDPGDKYGRSKLQLRNEGLIVETKKEIDSLRKQVNKEMEKIKKQNAKGKRDGGNADSMANAAGYGAQSDLVHQFQVGLDPDKAAYVCKVELATPIDYVILSGHIQGAQITGTNSLYGDVIISHTAMHHEDQARIDAEAAAKRRGDGQDNSPSKQPNNPLQGRKRSLLATVRPASTGDGDASSAAFGSEGASSPRVLEWSVRPVEGQSGEINIVVVSRHVRTIDMTSPSSKKRGKGKAAEATAAAADAASEAATAAAASSGEGVRFSGRSALELHMDILPLSLHQLQHSDALAVHGTNQPPAMSNLTIQGSFSAERAHRWLLRCLPGVTPQFDGVPHATQQLFFRNMLINTVLEIEYGSGSLVFRSDNISTLAIVKDFISKDAMEQSMRINISSDIHADAAPAMMNMLRPMIEAQFALSNDVALIDAVKEVASDDFNPKEAGGGSGCAYLDSRLIHLMTHADAMRKKLDASPERLQMLFGCVNDLFIDLHLFKGRKLVHLADKLGGMLGQYNHEQVLAFILNPQ